MGAPQRACTQLVLLATSAPPQFSTAAPSLPRPGSNITSIRRPGTGSADVNVSLAVPKASKAYSSAASVSAPRAPASVVDDSHYRTQLAEMHEQVGAPFPDFRVSLYGWVLWVLAAAWVGVRWQGLRGCLLASWCGGYPTAIPAQESELALTARLSSPIHAAPAVPGVPCTPCNCLSLSARPPAVCSFQAVLCMLQLG